MESIEDLFKPVEGEENNSTPSLKERKLVQPPAWKPSVNWDDLEGEVTTTPRLAPYKQWSEILRDLGYDPEYYEVVEPVKISSWDQQAKDGIEKLYSYRCGIRIKSPEEKIDYADLIREIKKHRPLNENLPGGELSFVVGIADTQFAKSDGDGLRGTIERFLNAIDGVEQRIRDLRKIGRPLGKLVILGLGDIIEGCVGNYPSQTFKVEANQRQQIRIARRLIRDAIARWSKLFYEVIVVCVPGNHGANKPNGREYTTPGDNWDVAIFEMIAEIFSANSKAYGHVKFIIPEDQISMTLDISGIRVGVAHGHITTGGGTPQQRVKNWWESQAFGDQVIGQADILITGHYHHLSVIQYGSKTHIQAPTLDGGSEYFVDSTGLDAPPGMLTLVIGESLNGGWDDLKII